MAYSYRQFLPNTSTLQNVVNRFTDFNLPSSQLRNISSRASSEASTAARGQYQQLDNVRNTLNQQRRDALNQIGQNQSLISRQFQSAIQGALQAANQQNDQRGAVNTGARIQDFLNLGNQAQAQSGQSLLQNSNQATQVQQGYISDLLSQYYAPRQQVASDQGQTALKSYQTYYDQAVQALYQGRVDQAQSLLDQAQRQYNSAIQAAQNQYQAEYASKQQQYQYMPSGGLSTASTPSSYQNDLNRAKKKADIPDDQIPAFNWIIQHESSFNPNAKNPSSSAHGYAQFINSTAKAYEKKTGLSYSNPSNQLVMAYQYMVDRYGSPEGAKAFWEKNHWY